MPAPAPKPHGPERAVGKIMENLETEGVEIERLRTSNTCLMAAMRALIDAWRIRDLDKGRVVDSSTRDE